MILCRQFIPLIRFSTRTYAKKKILKMNAKQVHQETLRHINPYAQINIRSDIYLNVRSADVHEYPDADAFLAELHGGHVSNCTATMKVQVSDDEKQVDVDVMKVAESTDFHCELDVPIRANLHIECKDGVSVSNMYCDSVGVSAKRSIHMKEIRAENISLRSDEGNITCDGMLLGKNSTIEAKSGNIALDKLQGDKLECTTVKGNISTNSCYADVSKFVTNTGSLMLKNVHKKTSVYVFEEGDINMTGVHGNIYLRSNGGKINLQLSELSGENIIMADKVNEASINISDAIEENAYVEITTKSPITLDSSLSHLSDCLSEDKNSFRMSCERDNHTKLMVCTNGPVKLGKQSWAENMRASLAFQEK